MANPSNRRVKVFHCKDNGNWIERGTGYLYLGLVQSSGYRFRVKSEDETQSLLIDCRAHPEDIYERQQDTLIVWCEPTSDEELALSFAQLQTCNWFIEELQNIRSGSPPSVIDFEEKEEIATPSLPPVSLSSLSEIEGVLTSSLHNISSKEKIIRTILDSEEGHPIGESEAIRQREGEESGEEPHDGKEGDGGGYICRLFALFRECEEKKDQASLAIIFRIVRSLIFLNEPSLFDILFRDDVILDMFGALEYDPENLCEHRKFLTQPHLFKEVLPLDDKEIEHKIHQTYRINYLKEVVMMKVLDDGTFGTLKAILYYNYIQIITNLQKKEKFFEKIFGEIVDRSVGEERRGELLGFVQELLSIVAKSLDMSERVSFYDDMEKFGMWKIFRKCFEEKSDRLCFLSANILVTILDHNCSQLRGWILKQEHPTLLHQIADIFTDAERMKNIDSSILSLLFDLFKKFLDPEGLRDVLEKEKMFSIVYPTLMESLLEPFQRNETEMTESEGTLWANLCELFRFCVEMHAMRMRTFCIRHPLLSSLLACLKCNSRHVVLAAIRFYRAVINRKDDFYVRNIILYRVFDAIIDLLKKNEGSYNLLHSAILDLFEFIRKEKLEKLRSHIVQQYSDYLRTLTHISLFDQLLHAHDAPFSNELSDNYDSQSSSFQDQEQEEAYFDASEEDDDSIVLIEAEREREREAEVDGDDSFRPRRSSPQFVGDDFPLPYRGVADEIDTINNQLRPLSPKMDSQRLSLSPKLDTLRLSLSPKSEHSPSLSPSSPDKVSERMRDSESDRESDREKKSADTLSPSSPLEFPLTNTIASPDSSALSPSSRIFSPPPTLLFSPPASSESHFMSPFHLDSHSPGLSSSSSSPPLLSSSASPLPSSPILPSSPLSLSSSDPDTEPKASRKRSLSPTSFATQSPQKRSKY